MTLVIVFISVTFGYFLFSQEERARSLDELRLKHADEINEIMEKNENQWEGARSVTDFGRFIIFIYMRRH